MGGLIRGQWVDNGLEIIWGLIGSVWSKYRVVAWSMAFYGSWVKGLQRYGRFSLSLF